jgi:hypothetical protein
VAYFLASWLVPAAVVVVGYAIFIESPASTLSHLSAQGVFGYANAKAAFFVQAAFALFVAVPVHVRSLGAFVSSTLLIPAVLVALVRRGRHVAIAIAAVVALSAIGTSFLLARAFANDRDSIFESGIADRLDRGRVEVWADAYGGSGAGSRMGAQRVPATRSRDRNHRAGIGAGATRMGVLEALECRNRGRGRGGTGIVRHRDPRLRGLRVPFPAPSRDHRRAGGIRLDGGRGRGCRS